MKTASEIIERALTLLDERLTELNEVATTEMSLSDMAADILPDTARKLVKELPYELKRTLAKSDTLTEESLSSGESQSGFVKQKISFTAPTDFWELVALRLSVWARPVTEYITVDSVEYAKQHNPFLRGGKHNPIVAVSNKASGDDIRIECFSIGSGDSKTVSTFQYISFDNVPGEAGVTAVKQKETVTLIGGVGELNISDTGNLSKNVSIAIDSVLSELATGFVTNNAAEYLEEGIVVTAEGDAIIFEALVAGTPFSAPVVSVLSGDAEATVTHTTANVIGVVGNPWPDELFDLISKALAMELGVIKGRIMESEIKNKEAEDTITQHK